ncbi:hypothetical protein KP509_32G019100 [Ceratopteris richardii]|nr:hypothetical protein KP509_32G019100 [Ceratopteris richardii]
MVMYLPLAVAKDLIYAYIKRHVRKKISDIPVELASLKESVIPASPSKANNGVSSKVTGIMQQHAIHIEHAIGYCSESEATKSKLSKKPVALSARDLAKNSFCIAPLWFMNEYLSNAALAYTSVASTTILSSTSSLFTLFFGAFLGQDSLSISKIVAVFVSITGVIMTTLGTTWAADEPEASPAEVTEHSITGDILGLLSAVSYGLFTVLLKKFAGKEEGGVDVQKVFGYIGLFTLVSLWWLVWPLTALKLEPAFSIPTSLKIDEVLIANGFVGSFLSDYFWALSVVWTTPLIATLGMSLTIPLAMVADILIHGRHFSAIYLLGSVQVFVGFLIANLSEYLMKRFGL